jgi:branched-chain amino acid transport system ATP-binding protein
MNGPVMNAALALADVRAGYRGKDILHGVSFEVPEGGALTIIGPNGSGKSTLLKVIVGLIPLSRGSINLRGRPISAETAPARARHGLAYVPQERNVFANLSVAENLRLGWEFLHPRAPQRERRARLDEVLGLFPEIRPLLALRAGLLSGGQRQMVAIAAALMQTPSLLVLDEPSAGLSPRNADLLFETIARIRKTGTSLLMIEQNVRLGLSVADIGLVLVAGQLRHCAPAQELAADPSLHQLYLGARDARDSVS